MSTAPTLDEYFAAATEWDSDRVAAARRSVRTAWWVAAAGWICALTSCAALIALMPLKQVDPFVIRVDRSTGAVDVVPVYAGRATESQVVTRYFLAHYVTVCERFNFATAAADYEECGAFQTPKENQAWFARWNRSNPASPLNVHKDGGTVSAQVESISFLKLAAGVSDLAQVRYYTATRDAGGSGLKIAHYIATVRYAYTAPSVDAQVRRWNPLGFKILYFHADREVLGNGPPTAPARPSALGGGAGA